MTLEDTRKAVAEVMGLGEDWPDHGNASLAITAAVAVLKLDKEKLEKQLAEANDHLAFVERWVNHHGQKPCHTPQEVLGVVQHYPPIVAITKSYGNGVVPGTYDPWPDANRWRFFVGLADRSDELWVEAMLAIPPADRADLEAIVDAGIKQHGISNEQKPITQG